MPPFVSKEDGQTTGASCVLLSKPRRRSLRKKREKPKPEPWKGLPGGPREPDSEDISIPNGVDLLALPQLCFPGIPLLSCLTSDLLLDISALEAVGLGGSRRPSLHLLSYLGIEFSCSWEFQR